MNYQPNAFSVNARDRLVGRSPGYYPGTANGNEICYCPSDPDTNNPQNWNSNSYGIFNPSIGNIGIWGASTTMGYNYFPATYSWYFGGWYVNAAGPTNPNTFMQPTIPMFSRFTVTNPTFSMKMGDRAQYKVLWADRIGVYAPLFGTGEFAGASNHMRGTQKIRARIPTNCVGGANVSYGDGHVEWKTAPDMAGATQYTWIYQPSGGPEIQQFAPTN